MACKHKEKEDTSFEVPSVGMRRFELPTSTSRTWRASQLCYIPIRNRFFDYGCKGKAFFPSAKRYALFFRLILIFLFARRC